MPADRRHPPHVTEDIALEGPPEVEFHPGIAARLPAKRVASGALLHDGHGRFVLVEPIYKDVWELPGGVVEDDEDPWQACRRELREELGTSREPGRPLVVDWVPRLGPWRDAVMFVFDGGRCTEADLAGFRLPPDELRSARLVHPDEAAPLLRPSTARRIDAALAALADGGTRYLCFGRDPGARPR